MTVGDLLRMPRDRLFRALDLIVRYDGDVAAAAAGEPGGL